jgi:hypothetical protein
MQIVEFHMPVNLFRRFQITHRYNPATRRAPRLWCKVGSAAARAQTVQAPCAERSSGTAHAGAPSHNCTVSHACLSSPLLHTLPFFIASRSSPLPRPPVQDNSERIRCFPAIKSPSSPLSLRFRPPLSTFGRRRSTLAETTRQQCIARIHSLALYPSY